MIRISVCILKKPIYSILNKSIREPKKKKNGEENKLDEQDDQMQSVFMDIIISVIQELHKKGVIKEQLGKEVPVIVHELEYYDLPIMWTTRSNPKSLIDEFLKSYNDGCL